MTVQIGSVFADVASTRAALSAGGVERNPLYDRAGTGLATRLAVGMGVVWALNHLHRSSPRVARRLAVIAIVLNVVATANNMIIAGSQ
jgi:hypothetical protein